MRGLSQKRKTQRCDFILQLFCQPHHLLYWFCDPPKPKETPSWPTCVLELGAEPKSKFWLDSPLLFPLPFAATSSWVDELSFFSSEVEVEGFGPKEVALKVSQSWSEGLEEEVAPFSLLGESVSGVVVEVVDGPEADPNPGWAADDVGLADVEVDAELDFGSSSSISLTSDEEEAT